MTVSAHWDNVEGSNGYNDNGSGVAVLLALQHNIPDNVELLFCDWEEYGGRGSRFYLENNTPAFNINLDVVGHGDKIFYDFYGKQALKLVDDMSAPSLLSEGVEFYPSVPFNDSYIFQEYDVESVLFITGNSHKTVIKEIWERQHGGKYDNDITKVEEKPIQMVIDHLLKVFDNIKGFKNGIVK